MDTLWFQVLTLMIRESDLEVCFCTAEKVCVCVCERDKFERGKHETSDYIGPMGNSK